MPPSNTVQCQTRYTKSPIPPTPLFLNHVLSLPSTMEGAANPHWQMIRLSTMPMMVTDQCGVSGILFKWVNYGRGWRPRWFVLQDGVLSYFKIHGQKKIVISDNVSERFPGKVIGEESLRWISRHSRSRSRLCKPIGEVHLKVASITESQSDEKRFCVYTGMKRLHLRAESCEDRTMWLEALQAVKEMYPRNSNNDVLVKNVPAAVSTERLRQRLTEEGLSEEAIKDSEQIMCDEFAVLQRNVLTLKQKQVMLLETMRQLETDKVDLENAVIGESQSESKHRVSLQISRDGTPSESDDPREEEESDDEIEFFDTFDALSSSPLRGSPSDFQRSSYNSNDDEDMSLDGSATGSEYPYVKRRKKLPDPAEKEKGVSLWSLIKDNIGKDLTKVCLPVYFNEPISTLQKSFEDLEYSYLLDRAYEWGKKGNSLMRALNVAAFTVSGYAATEGRHCKPFNPLLGETFEANYPDKGIRFFSEKVSHHPMVIACHCEGRGWKIWGDSNLKSKFCGRSIQVDPVGILTLEFDDGEVFQWSKVTSSIYNLILGKIYCDHHGIMHIKGNQNYSCRLKFKEQSIMDKNPHQVQGCVQDQNGKTVATLFGKWDDSMHYVNGERSAKGKGSEHHLLWKRAKPSQFPTKYNLTSFAITLNELTPGLKERLPPTDSRLRPDQRCLENGEYEKANSEKLRLEEKQRQARVMQEKGWKPRWFAKENGSSTYRYTGGYWEARETGNWQSCPDIFGNSSSDQNLD